MATGVEYLFMWLFAMCLSSLMECLFQSFAIFAIGQFIFLLLRLEAFIYSGYNFFVRI